MCSNINLSTSIRTLTPPIQVVLPTGLCISVTQSGSVTSTPDLVFTKCFTHTKVSL